MDKKHSDRYKEKELADKKIESDAKSLGHTHKYVSGSGHSDSYTCSCGWTSRTYWDGAEYAFDEWLEHAKNIVAEGQAHLDLRTS